MRYIFVTLPKKRGGIKSETFDTKIGNASRSTFWRDGWKKPNSIMISRSYISDTCRYEYKHWKKSNFTCKAHFLRSVHSYLSIDAKNEQLIHYYCSSMKPWPRITNDQITLPKTWMGWFPGESSSLKMCERSSRRCERARRIFERSFWPDGNLEGTLFSRARGKRDKGDRSKRTLYAKTKGSFKWDFLLPLSFGGHTQSVFLTKRNKIEWY